MDYGRPLTPEQVEEERKKLMDVISKSEREGKINIRKRRKMSMLEGEEAAAPAEGAAPLAGGAPGAAPGAAAPAAKAAAPAAKAPEKK